MKTKKILLLLIIIASMASVSTFAGTWRVNFNVDNGWWQRGSVQSEVKDGRLHLRQIHVGNEEVIFPLPNPRIPESEDWTDYTVKMRIQFTKWSERGGGISLHVRQRVDPKQPFAVKLGYEASLAHLNEGPIRDWMSIEKSMLRGPVKETRKVQRWNFQKEIKRNRWYDLEVTAKEKTISFSMINENIELSFTDDKVKSPYTEGEIMFSLHGADVQIDYIEITGPRVPTLAVSPKAKLTTTWGQIKRQP